MRPILGFSLALLLTAALVAGVAGLMSGAQTGSAQSFTATFVVTMYDPEGRPARQHTELYAVRADGSAALVRFRQGPEGVLRRSRTVVDLSRGVRIAVEPATESTTTYPIGPGTPLPEVHPRLTYEGGEAGSERIIAGFRALRVQQQIAPSPPSSGVRREVWAAPFLGCLPLEGKSYLTAGHAPPVLTETREALAVQLGEPDPDLFDIPQNYTERSPGQVFAEYERRFGTRAAPPETGLLLDEAYQRGR